MQDQKSGKYIKPLTKAMIELLMDCHERALMHAPPVDILTPCGIALARRNLVSVMPFTNEKGKSIMCLYINDAGVGFLHKLVSKSSIRPGNEQPAIERQQVCVKCTTVHNAARPCEEIHPSYIPGET